MNTTFLFVFGLTLCFATQKASGVDEALAVWKMILSTTGSAEILGMDEATLKNQKVNKQAFYNMTKIKPEVDPVTYDAYELIVGQYKLAVIKESMSQNTTGGMSGR
ncbi:uncharacterized protein LOC126837992 [Adelges cooleyi]|uniref:uncharacterized protein LOC126837992 n=1 Tax=Adelges cooleyi TaxID=133065 RepID=UPI002180890E|nr:uncharacterized protein LOC126837992 [Adelges cooleyi]